MAQVRAEPDEVSKQRGLQRRRRRRAGLPVIAIVGYTNAGKSTLNGGRTPTCWRDMLFATLTPPRGGWPCPAQGGAFTDTVGSSKAAHAARRPFTPPSKRHEADILHGGHHRPQRVEEAAVNEVLHEIEADDKPMIRR